MPGIRRHISEEVSMVLRQIPVTFDLLPKDKSQQIGGNKVKEERIYKFIAKEFDVSYLVTKEELQVLNTSYEKEKYGDKRQYKRNNVCCFSDLDQEDCSVEETIEDQSQDTEYQATAPMLMEQLFATLTPVEKKVVVRILIQGYPATELEEEFQKKSHEILRYKKKAIAKMNQCLKDMGINSYGEALEMFLR
jgi:hypothetical protein